MKQSTGRDSGTYTPAGFADPPKKIPARQKPDGHPPQSHGIWRACIIRMLGLFPALQVQIVQADSLGR